MEVELFVEQYRELVKRCGSTRASQPAAVRPLENVVLHCFRLEDAYSYRETRNRLKYMAGVRDVLGSNRDGLSNYSTVYKLFDRLKM